MNGEEKSYRLNDPMKWEEFKSMPDDIQVMYIKLLRQKFNVPDRRMAAMMGVSQNVFCREMRKLGIGSGANSRARNTPWDKEGFYAWCGLSPKTVEEPIEEKVEEIPVEEPAVIEETTVEEVIEEIVEEVKPEPVAEAPVRKKVIPMTGNMLFEGLAEDVLQSVYVLLSGAKVQLSIKWDVLDEEV